MFDQLLDRALDLITQILGDGATRRQTIRAGLLFLFAIVATLFSIYWKTLLFKIGSIRRQVDPRERLCGTYFQTSFSESEGLRYTILTLQFGKGALYHVRGAAHWPDGNHSASFESRYVVFPSPSSFEYVWSGRENDLPVELSGFTRIEFGEDAVGKSAKGRGYFIDFIVPPRVSRCRIERLSVVPEDIRAYILKYHELHGNQLSTEFLSGTLMPVVREPRLALTQ